MFPVTSFKISILGARQSHPLNLVRRVAYLAQNNPIRRVSKNDSNTREGRIVVEVVECTMALQTEGFADGERLQTRERLAD